MFFFFVRSSFFFLLSPFFSYIFSLFLFLRLFLFSSTFYYFFHFCFYFIYVFRYAVCEFDSGSEDRGRSVFEELVGTYPKRTDLWHVYVDKEVKSGNHLQARQLFERMISAQHNAKAMKAAFKKYLLFEQQHGSLDQQEGVKNKAREYVSSII